MNKYVSKRKHSVKEEIQRTEELRQRRKIEYKFIYMYEVLKKIWLEERKNQIEERMVREEKQRNNRKEMQKLREKLMEKFINLLVEEQIGFLKKTREENKIDH